MIREATADDIKRVVRLLEQQAQVLGWQFDYDVALDSTRRQAVLATSTVLVADRGDTITGVLFALLSNTGFNEQIQMHITNVWTEDHNQEVAELLISAACAAGDRNSVDEILIAQIAGQEFDLPGLEPTITISRIR